MKQKIIILILVFWFFGFSAAKSQPQALLYNDTLTLSNNLIKRQFLWNNGELISCRFLDYKNGKNMVVASSFPTFNFSEKVELISSHFEKRKIEKNNLRNVGLEAEITLDYGSFKLRRVFRISENVPAIACDNYIWINRETDNKKIEDFFRKPVEIERFDTEFNFPWLKAVEFYDRTDVNNNLVRTVEAQSYIRDLELRGNLLQVYPVESGQPGIFVLKEAPCSFVQLDYPGYDFRIKKNTVTVEGTGLITDEHLKGQWVRLYGTVTGVYDGSEPGLMMSLRNYQNSLRHTIPERDNMIMMNTWGDQNKDSRISEPFLKAELDKCQELGITHFQIDDGWQQGLSVNSANAAGNKWDLWSEKDWLPNKERLPNGLRSIAKYAGERGVHLGLWFHPSTFNSYENWKTDARIILDFYNVYGICYFKIDGTKLPDKLAEHRLKLLFDTVSSKSNGEIVINLDATSGNRAGYHYMNTYGNIFLENRYTDRGNYYPHWTLRNLWQLSAYVPTKNLQIEFLNKWRNSDIYGVDNPLAPFAVPFEYQFAITMMAQPLAWFEGTGLPEEAMKIALVIKKYRDIQHDIHSGYVFPIGEEPNGYTWTGFQSVKNAESGYMLVFREKTSEISHYLETLLPPNKPVVLTPILGKGKMIKATPNSKREIQFELPEEFSYCLYRYEVVK